MFLTLSEPVYFTKERAAKISGLSLRRLQELAKAGEIRRHYTRDEQTNRNIVLYHGADIETLFRRRNELETGLVPRSQSQPPAAIAPTTQWLTLADAALFTGLPESFLRELVERGTIAAFDVGVRPGGRWRVSRRDLESLHAPKHIGGVKKKRISQK